MYFYGQLSRCPCNNTVSKGTLTPLTVWGLPGLSHFPLANINTEQFAVLFPTTWVISLSHFLELLVDWEDV